MPYSADKSFLSREDAEAYVAGKKTSSTTPGEERYYAVAVGREPGVYTDWDTASLAIKGWKGPKYKRFDTREDAENYIRAHGDAAAQATLGEDADEPPAKKSKKTTTVEIPDAPDVLHVYTDGSSLANGRAGAVAGVGVWFGEGDKRLVRGSSSVKGRHANAVLRRNVSERLQGEPQTNQRAELTAVLRALERVPLDQKIRIFSDSKYAISCVDEWYVNWQKNDWMTSTGPVKNRDIIEAILEKIEERIEAGGTRPLWRWVKGHSDTIGNIAADDLAVKGARRRA
ncbi:ribonuclease H-like protein [Hypoxylon sp. FL1284]|nr:ribonuclease H-like protein [Hypoxylon sp. FL1284]KAI0181376.1 ribonuclease H-like protein [Hypoxylon sp. FL1284]